jgi:hypothetical protein
MRFIELLLKQLPGARKPRDRQAIIRQLTAEEAAIGGQLFGPLPEGRRRDFFALDAHTWVWHEGWHDPSGREVLITTRYEIDGQRIVKIQDGQPHRLLSLAEARNLLSAVREYRRRVRADVYGLPA